MTDMLDWVRTDMDYTAPELWGSKMDSWFRILRQSQDEARTAGKADALREAAAICKSQLRLCDVLPEDAPRTAAQNDILRYCTKTILALSPSPSEAGGADAH